MPPSPFHRATRHVHVQHHAPSQSLAPPLPLPHPRTHASAPSIATISTAKATITGTATHNATAVPMTHLHRAPHPAQPAIPYTLVDPQAFLSLLPSP